MNDSLTRLQLLGLIIGRARSNGFKFRHWYTHRLGEPWINSQVSLQLLEDHRRYYSLLFSHEFARSFWKPGSEITFQVAAQTFQRRMPDGTVGTVSRKAFTRRSARPDAWRFHLREMALAEDPLRYLRKYLLIQENDALPGSVAQPACTFQGEHLTASRTGAARRPAMRPLPQEPPAFLRRPYAGREVNRSLRPERASSCDSGRNAGSEFKQETQMGVNSTSA